jgi:hypothetical protein
MTSSSSELAFHCPHLEAIQAPRADQIVHREGCTQCFDSQVSNPIRDTHSLLLLLRPLRAWLTLGWSEWS